MIKQITIIQFVICYGRRINIEQYMYNIQCKIYIKKRERIENICLLYYMM